MYWPGPTTRSQDPTSSPGSPATPSLHHSPLSSASSSPLSSAGSSYGHSRSASPSSTAIQGPTKADNEREAWSALQDAHTDDVLRSVLRVRKTWKTARGGETVWPLELEAALLEGLEQYVPDDSRETRMLGRFPRRNRFISDYILAKTGKRRTPKQVGSRLQQLRESCGGQKLLHLLSPFREPPPSPSSTADSSLGSPHLSDGSSFTQTPAAPHTTVYIDILPNQPAHAEPRSSTLPLTPRRIAQINPLSTFTSPAPLSAHARFTVLSESAGLVLHAESVPLELLADSPESEAAFAAGLYYYSAKIVPCYWSVILESPDPTRFTIFQEIVKDDSAASLLFTATYRFRYPPSQARTRYNSPSQVHLALPELDDLDLGLGLGYVPTSRSPHMESNFRSTMNASVGGSAVTGGWPLH
ncbi:hypothetical protein C8F01DRAFT_1129648 [Mycena amicta]|nr:hypothetical protein C8F01DRAFT_1129648 [Mycena amicta]